MSIFEKKHIGHIEIADKCYIVQHKKPCLWHRVWMRILLGWKWHDGNVLRGD